MVAFVHLHVGNANQETDTEYNSTINYFEVLLRTLQAVMLFINNVKQPSFRAVFVKLVLFFPSAGLMNTLMLCAFYRKSYDRVSSASVVACF